MKNSENTYVTFHIGRGGNFHNPGYKTFEDVMDFQELLELEFNKNYLYEIEDENGNVIGIADENGNELVNANEINDLIGVLDYDGDYDTYLTKEINNCDCDELQLCFNNRDYFYLNDKINLVKALDYDYDFINEVDDEELLSFYIENKDLSSEMPNIKKYLIKWGYIDDDNNIL